MGEWQAGKSLLALSQEPDVRLKAQGQQRPQAATRA